MVIAGECGNHMFMPTDDDGGWGDYNAHGSDNCDDGEKTGPTPYPGHPPNWSKDPKLGGCSFQFVALPETTAALKAIGFDNMQDDDSPSKKKNQFIDPECTQGH